MKFTITRDATAIAKFASTDSFHPVLQALHVRPDGSMEASDGFQFIRSAPGLVKRAKDWLVPAARVVGLAGSIAAAGKESKRKVASLTVDLEPIETEKPFPAGDKILEQDPDLEYAVVIVNPVRLAAMCSAAREVGAHFLTLRVPLQRDVGAGPIVPTSHPILLGFRTRELRPEGEEPVEFYAALMGMMADDPVVPPVAS